MNRLLCTGLTAALAFALVAAAGSAAEDVANPAASPASPGVSALVIAAPAPAPLTQRTPDETQKAKDKEREKDEDAAEDDKAEDGAGGRGTAEREDDEEVDGPPIERLRAFYPEKLAGFDRTGFRQFDPDGEDASVSYNLLHEGKLTWVAFTGYFYPARGESLDDDVEIAAAEVSAQHREAEVGETEVIEVTRRGKKREGRRVRFKFTHAFAGKEQLLNSELYLFAAGPGRVVKYRITFPAADAETLQKRVDKFATSFPWPKGL